MRSFKSAVIYLNNYLLAQTGDHVAAGWPNGAYKVI